jgi:hypothetical protein
MHRWNEKRKRERMLSAITFFQKEARIKKSEARIV